MTEFVVPTPAVETAMTLLRECMATQSIGALIGSNGVGKTFALKAVEGRYSKLGLGGACLRYRCCEVRGSTRGVRDLLMHLGGRLASLRNGVTGGLQLYAKMAQAEFRKRDIRVLLLDEADLWDVAALGGLITLFDTLREGGLPLTIVLTGILPPAQWLDQLSSLRSRTLRVETVTPLSKETLLGVCQEWAEPFRQLAADVDAKKPASQKLLRTIFSGTQGNLRRARQLCDLLLMQGPQFELSEQTVLTAFGKMLRPNGSS